MSRPNIKERVYTSGKRSWGVDAGKINGKRHRRFFPSKGEAKTYADQILTARKNHGAQAFALTEVQRFEAVEAFSKLKNFGVSLAEVVDSYLKRVDPKADPVPVGQVIDELLKKKIQNNNKPRYIETLKCILGIFSRSFGDKPICELESDEIDNWLNTLDIVLVTRNNYLRILSVLFQFAVNRGYCGENIVSKIDRAIIDTPPPGILTVEQASRILAEASADPEQGLLPGITIGLFAGLRSCELKQIKWEEINLSTGNIEVTAEKSKSRHRRLVTVSPNLLAWLKPIAREHGLVLPPNWYGRLGRLKKLANIQDWPDNAMRHSFASYHYARHQSADKTAFQLGHQDTKILFEHYRELVTREEAKRYWSLFPDKVSKVPQLNLAAA